MDFVLLEDEADPILKLIMVTEKSAGEFFLQIREFPTFNTLYELKVSKYCKLLDTSLNQESPMFVEGSFGIVDTESENTENSLNVSNVSIDDKTEIKRSMEADLVKMLRIRGICEGNPEARMSRLLRRGKFEAAEK